MKKLKNNFFVGILIAIILFLLLYSVISLIVGTPFFMKDSENLWIYIISAIPNFFLFRFMIIKWDMEKTGKGMMFITLIGVVVIMFFVLR